MVDLKNEDGYGLVLVIILLTVTIVLIMSLMQTTINEFKFVKYEEKELQAYYIAKSGANIVGTAIEESLVSSEEIIDKSSFPTELGNGNFEVNVTKTGNVIKINSTGTVDDVSTTVLLELIEKGSNFDMALFSLGNINFNGQRINGDIGTNLVGQNSIKIDYGKLNGDAYIGPGGDPEEAVSIPKWNNINGEKRNLDSVREYILPDYPNFPEQMDSLNGTYTAGWWPSPPHLLNNNLWKDTVNVTSELIVDVYDEDIIVGVNSLSVTGSGKITVNRYGDGKLIFYVKNDFQINGSGSINKNGDVDDVIMYYSGDNQLNPSGSTKFVGSVYAENSDIGISGSGGIIGHIVTGGDNVSISGDASANVKALYAPNAHVSFTGSGHLKGAVIANTASVVGGSYIDYDDSINDSIPEEFGISGRGSYERTWN